MVIFSGIIILIIIIVIIIIIIIVIIHWHYHHYKPHYLLIVGWCALTLLAWAHHSIVIETIINVTTIIRVIISMMIIITIVTTITMMTPACECCWSVGGLLFHQQSHLLLFFSFVAFVWVRACFLLGILASFVADLFREKGEVLTQVTGFVLQTPVSTKQMDFRINSIPWECQNVLLLLFVLYFCYLGRLVADLSFRRIFLIFYFLLFGSSGWWCECQKRSRPHRSTERELWPDVCKKENASEIHFCQDWKYFEVLIDANTLILGFLC